MNDTTYNGWFNYETWLVNLWLTNDAPGVEPGTSAEDFKFLVEDMIEDQIGVPTGLLYDLLKSAVDSVDWHELEGHHAPED